MKHSTKMMLVNGRDREDYADAKYRDRRERERYETGRYAPKSEWEAYITGGLDDKWNDEISRSTRPIDSAEYIPPSMNQIGFSTGEEIRHNYGSRVEDGATTSDKIEKGGANHSTRFTSDTARSWINGLKNADGTTGAHWNMDEINNIVRQKSLDCDPLELWATMNMMYSDYSKVAKKMNTNNVDFYLAMSLAFLNDADAVPNKLAAYYESVVKHA